MLKLYRVYDGKSYVGSYLAKNEKLAIRRAQAEQIASCAGFRKSMPPIIFKNPRAEETVQSQ
jgi:hypothetical protein